MKRKEIEKEVMILKNRIRTLMEKLTTVGKSKKKEIEPIINEMEKRIENLQNMEKNHDAIEIVRLARNQKRPTTLDYIKLMVTDFLELHGDRRFSDDQAIVGGIGMIDGIPITIIGHQKGRNTTENIKRHFGMAHPEGYRKALRLMEQAERFSRPIITLVDTPGAYPGIGAEERGQAEAIAYNLYRMSGFKTPIITIITGEGGSGGALALAVADKVFMLSNAIYSVISPEGCAAILWKDATKASEAAEALKITAKDVLKLGVIDNIIEEPGEGAHTNHEEMAKRLKKVILESINELIKFNPENLIEKRYEKFRKMGAFIDDFTHNS